MARQQTQRGPQTPRFERRYGSDGVPSPGGVNSEAGYQNPCAVPPHQFMQLINVDWQGDDIIPRGGSEKVNSEERLHGPRASLFAINFDMGAPKRVWIIGDGLPEEGVSGQYLGQYDPEQCPRLQREIWYRDADEADPAVICSYNGAPYVVIGSELLRLNLGSRSWGQEGLDVNGEEANIPVASLPTNSVAHSAIEFDGKLFIAVTDGSSDGAIWVWDGLTFQEDENFTTDIPVALGLYADTMLVGFEAASDQIAYRPFGDPGTAYTTKAPDTGTVATRAGNNSIKSFLNKAYGAGNVVDIWSWDGTTLTGAVHTAADPVTCLAIQFGLLIYSNGTALGTFDGTTWTDVVKQLSGDLPNFTEVAGMVAYRGTIVAAAIPADDVLHLLISPVLFADFDDAQYEDLHYGGVYDGSAFYLEVI